MFDEHLFELVGEIIMDIAAHATGGINGIDLLLWIGLIYVAPHVLKFRPRKRAPQRVPQRATRRLRPAMTEEGSLKVA